MHHVKMPNLSNNIEYHAFSNGSWVASAKGSSVAIVGIITRRRRTVDGDGSIPEGPWAIKPVATRDSGIKEVNYPHAHSFSISQMASSLMAEGWPWVDIHHLVAYMCAHMEAMHMPRED
jgi:hypothetical protein